jgi:hypothetical protein
LENRTNWDHYGHVCRLHGFPDYERPQYDLRNALQSSWAGSEHEPTPLCSSGNYWLTTLRSSRTLEHSIELAFFFMLVRKNFNSSIVCPSTLLVHVDNSDELLVTHFRWYRIVRDLEPLHQKNYIGSLITPR